MNDMPYDTLIAHLAAKTIEAVEQNDMDEAQKICFTLIQESYKFEASRPENELFTEAFKSIRELPQGDNIYNTMFLAHHKLTG